MSNEESVKEEEQIQKLPESAVSDYKEPEQVPEKTAEEKAKDPDYDPIGNATPEEREAYFSQLETNIRESINSNDPLVGLHVRPGSLETVADWYFALRLHENEEIEQRIRERIQLRPDPGVLNPPVVLVRPSMILYQQLYTYFTEKGLFYNMTRNGIQFQPTLELLQLLYLIDCKDTPATKAPTTKFEPTIDIR